MVYIIINERLSLTPQYLSLYGHNELSLFVLDTGWALIFGSSINGDFVESASSSLPGQMLSVNQKAESIVLWLLRLWL